MKRRFAVIALALAMVLTMGASVFAETATGDTADNSTGFYITNILKIAEGITVPDETFTFTFAKGDSSYENDAAYVDPANTAYPDLAAAAVTYSAEDRAADGTDTEITKVSDKITVDASKFPHSGMYVYKVTETAGSTEGMSYDTESVYFVKVYIKNSKAGEKTVADIEISDGKEKVDATNDGGEEASNGEDGSYDVNGNGFVFTNTYTKEITVNPGDSEGENKDGAFVLEKKITGDYAGADDVFKFDVTVDYPDTYTGAAKASTGDFEATFADGQKVTVSLKGGQMMKFASLPAGTKVTVNEQAFENYIANYVAKHGVNDAKNGAAEASSNNSAKNTALSAGALTVGDYGANAEYTNAFESVAPTGIIINNLPYILLIAIALGGIVMFTRKRRYE